MTDDYCQTCNFELELDQCDPTRHEDWPKGWLEEYGGDDHTGWALIKEPDGTFRLWRKYIAGWNPTAYTDEIACYMIDRLRE